MGLDLLARQKIQLTESYLFRSILPFEQTEPVIEGMEFFGLKFSVLNLSVNLCRYLYLDNKIF